MNHPSNSQWNVNRFAKTLAYFGAIPFLGNLKCLQQWLGIQNHAPMTPTERILVIGATGGVGKRVVKRLLTQGYQVRVLVRDLNKAREILGNQVELIGGDLTISETLTTSITNNIDRVICCSGTKVQPVEGDTPTREKYYQGLKFYLPEVVDIPELVEYQGIKNLIDSTLPQLQKIGTRTLFDFTQPNQNLREIWGALDDIVMGGISESSLRMIHQSALFTGNVSTANSGGFVSVRTRNFNPPLNLSSYEGIELRIKGDGKRYKFIIRNEEKWDGIGYCYSFDTVYNIWMSVLIPFSQLIPVFRAKTVKNAQPFDGSHITSFQLMLSKFEYDGELNPKFSPGLFQLEMESIKAYNPQSPRFILVSSAGVTRPGRPGINLEEEPPAVRMNEQLGGILTWKLKGEDYLRSSGIPYTIIRPCALTEEPGGQKLIAAQGDNIKGKVSREDLAELCVKLLDQPSACHLTFEVKESENGQTLDHLSQFLQPLIKE